MAILSMSHGPMWQKQSMKIELKPHERLDDLVLDGMKIIQRDDQFCFSLDTVLLAHFGPVPHGPALDLGTGTAAIPLILTSRGAADITGVELNPVMADIARRNAGINGREECIHIIEEDYRRIRSWSASGAYAAVYVNPPYREKARGAVSEAEGIRRARHEETATLTDVMEAARYALKYHGRFRMIHIADRLTDVLAAMRCYGLEPKAVQMIHGRAHKKAKLFLVEGIRGGNPGMSIEPPVIVHDEDGFYSHAVLAMYGKAVCLGTGKEGM